MSDDKKPNKIILESISRDLKQLSLDIFFIKNEIKCIKDVFIQKKNIEKKDDNEWIKEEEEIGWRLW